MLLLYTGFVHFLNNVSKAFKWIILAFVFFDLSLLFNPSADFILVFNLSLLLCCILTLILDTGFEHSLNNVSNAIIHLHTNVYQCLFIAFIYVVFIPVIIILIGPLLIIG